MTEPTVHVYRRARGVARLALREEPALTEPPLLVQYRMIDAAVEAVWLIADAAARKDEREALRELLADLTDPDPCQYDHHGYCQAHGWMTTESRCPHARAKDLIAATSPTGDPTR